MSRDFCSPVMLLVPSPYCWFSANPATTCSSTQYRDTHARRVVSRRRLYVKARGCKASRQGSLCTTQRTELEDLVQPLMLALLLLARRG